MSAILNKLPSMTDESLRTLQDNAQRLEQGGTAAQRKAAAALLPAVEAEVAARTRARLAHARDKAALKKAAGKQATKRVQPPSDTAD